jgi:hypothetical protein
MPANRLGRGATLETIRHGGRHPCSKSTILQVNEGQRAFGCHDWLRPSEACVSKARDWRMWTATVDKEEAAAADHVTRKHPLVLLVSRSLGNSNIFYQHEVG